MSILEIFFTPMPHFKFKGGQALIKINNATQVAQKTIIIYASQQNAQVFDTFVLFFSTLMRFFPIKKICTHLSHYLFQIFQFLALCKYHSIYIIVVMAKKKKPLTKTQYMEQNSTVLNLLARLMVCAFLLGVIIFSLPM